MTSRYKAILCDPPWRFNVRSEKGTGRGAIAHYPVMSLKDIKALPVQDWAADDCALFLWAIDPMLPQALEVIEAWGFTFKTVAFYWVKQNKDGSPFTGLGYWTRANAEQCLLATRGRPRRLARNIKRVHLSLRREHSRKPDAIADEITRLVAGPYLEMFAREARAGWEAMGNQTDLFNEGAVETRNRPSNMSGKNDSHSI